MRASGSPAVTENGKVTKKLMLTPKNKLSDSISATAGETYINSMIGACSDVHGSQAFETPALVAAVKAEALVKMKTELRN